MLAELAAAEITTTPRAVNIGHNPSRMTFVARHALKAGRDPDAAR